MGLEWEETAGDDVEDEMDRVGGGKAFLYRPERTKYARILAKRDGITWKMPL